MVTAIATEPSNLIGMQGNLLLQPVPQISLPTAQVKAPVTQLPLQRQIACPLGRVGPRCRTRSRLAVRGTTCTENGRPALEDQLVFEPAVAEWPLSHVVLARKPLVGGPEVSRERSRPGLKKRSRFGPRFDSNMAIGPCIRIL